MNKTQFIIMGIAVIVLSSVCRLFDIELEDPMFLYVLAPCGLAVGFLVATKGDSG